jgi:hypothetical protein
MGHSAGRGKAVAAVIAAASSVALGVVTLSGFGGADSGDLVVPSSPASTILLLLGALMLVELELARLRRQRRPHPAQVAVEAARA